MAWRVEGEKENPTILEVLRDSGIFDEFIWLSSISLE